MVKVAVDQPAPYVREIARSITTRGEGLKRGVVDYEVDGKGTVVVDYVDVAVGGDESEEGEEGEQAVIKAKGCRRLAYKAWSNGVPMD